MIANCPMRQLHRCVFILLTLWTLVLMQVGKSHAGGAHGGVEQGSTTKDYGEKEDGGAFVARKEEEEATVAEPLQPETKDPESSTFDVKSHVDWGSYYDPQNIFCGKYDCYRILGFDYDSFGTNIPDSKIITKRYRNLSREWHPDKSKHKNAKELFVKIARAYEVLTNEQQRLEYDYMRYNQEAYFQKYGANVLWQYAPKSDATIIILVLIVLVNWFTWVAQKSRWQNVADRLTQAAVEDWSPSQGGTAESKQLREEALRVLVERQQGNMYDSVIVPTVSSRLSTSTRASKKGKVSGKDKKKLEQESLKPIIRELVTEIRDFGAGFHKPTWRDLFVVRIVTTPYHLTLAIWWQLMYIFRRLQKKDLNEEERRVLTARAVGKVTWDLASAAQRSELVARELWVMDNLAQWKEEQEVKTWSKSDQKFYHKMKKKENKSGKDL